jgi:hypothetical protein
VKGQLLPGVADPHHFDADPDPAFYSDADPDPTFHFGAEPYPDPTCQLDADPDSTTHFFPDWDPHCSKMTL